MCTHANLIFRLVKRMICLNTKNMLVTVRLLMKIAAICLESVSTGKHISRPSEQSRLCFITSSKYFLGSVFLTFLHRKYPLLPKRSVISTAIYWPSELFLQLMHQSRETFFHHFKACDPSRWLVPSHPHDADVEPIVLWRLLDDILIPGPLGRLDVPPSQISIN